MKKTIKYAALLFAASTFTFASCGGDEPNIGGGGNSGGGSSGGGGQQSITDPFQGDPSVAFTFELSGQINHDTYDASQGGKVTFSRIPQNLDEFKKAQETLGLEPHGAVALQVMAMEMYLRNPNVGLEALKLNNVTSNVEAVVSRLKEHRVSKVADSYKQRYIVAALIKGATPGNGYNPPAPYVTEMRVNPAVKYIKREGFMGEGIVLHIEINREGSDTNWRNCEVTKEQGSKYFKVFNSPALYAQTKMIGYGQTFNGLK